MVRLTPRELRAWHKAAKEDSRTTSAWVRHRINEEMARKRAP
jgi:hypothetical protein